MPPYNSKWNRDDDPILDPVPVTPANTDLAGGPTKAILLSADGTVDIVTAAGTTRTGIPLAGLVMHKLCAARITACTASVWACY
jgi:hypothetical protein